MKTYLSVLLCALVICECRLPKGFGFGASTAAFQIEGAWLADDKSMSIWDNLDHTIGSVGDHTTADIVDDSYNLYDQDISLMKEYGIRNYRMSIAWTRILPYGNKGSSANMKAITHYREQFKALIAAGITPYVTLYHGDLPMMMMIEGEGFLDPDFVSNFVNYASVCFTYFGDLVKYWFTFNEPWCIAAFDSCEPHEESTRPYKLGHALLLAHSEAVDLYRKQFQPTQGGKIGWVLNSEMFFPKDPNNPEDVEAANRGLAFQLDWFSDPLFTGDYPPIMRQIVGDRLPVFTEEQKAKLKGSADFYALNHYFTFLSEKDHEPSGEGKNFWDDRNVKTSYDPEWKLTDNGWPVVPEGFHKLITHVHEHWLKGTDMELYITENGAAIKEPDSASVVYDLERIDYLQRYVSEVSKAIDEGVNITKYFIWSLLDNFEWGGGLSKRFGVVRVEYGEHPVRIPKRSLKWFAELIKDTQ